MHIIRVCLKISLSFSLIHPVRTHCHFSFMNLMKCDTCTYTQKQNQQKYLLLVAFLFELFSFVLWCVFVFSFAAIAIASVVVVVDVRFVHFGFMRIGLSSSESGRLLDGLIIIVIVVFSCRCYIHICSRTIC